MRTFSAWLEIVAGTPGVCAPRAMPQRTPAIADSSPSKSATSPPGVSSRTDPADPIADLALREAGRHGELRRSGAAGSRSGMRSGPGIRRRS
jgi:hypothetical protein